MMPPVQGGPLAVFLYTYNLFRNGYALVTVILIADRMRGGAQSPEYHMLKFTIRLAIGVLLLLYFFKSNVLTYFRLENVNKAKAIGISVGIALGIIAVGSAIGQFNR